MTWNAGGAFGGRGDGRTGKVSGVYTIKVHILIVIIQQVNNCSTPDLISVVLNPESIANQLSPLSVLLYTLDCLVPTYTVIGFFVSILKANT